MYLIFWQLERQPGQGGTADPPIRDLRVQLLEAEAAHFNKTQNSSTGDDEQADTIQSVERQIEAESGEKGDAYIEHPDVKRRRILEETRDIDADSEGSESDSSDEDRLVPAHNIDVFGTKS